MPSELYGLVLAGGKSLRMGKDKAQISYHGIPHSIYLYNLLQNFCDKTYLSLRGDQQLEYREEFQIIKDQDRYRGPFNGLLSAYDSAPEVAWLVVACDLPLMDLSTIENLIEQRNSKKIATALATRKTGLPEPLAAIWESNGLYEAIDYLSKSDSSCPRKYLLNSDIKLVYPAEDKVLLNANSEEEYLEVLRILATV